MLDYLWAAGKTPDLHQSNMQPMAIEMTTTTTGTITSSSLYTTAPFHNPGNRLSVSIPENVPYYNEAMGVFSLLKKPVIQTRTTTTTNPDRSRKTVRGYRLADDLQYVINPASGLVVQDFRVALMVEGNEVEPFGGDYTLEGQVTQPDGTFNYLYRTNYVDAACIKNTIFQTEALGGTGDPSQEFMYKGAYLKVILNLRPTAATPTQQNVLFVARYPITLSAVSSFTSLPFAACGVLPQATNATINAVCQGTKYKQAIALARPGRPSSTALGSTPTQAALQAYPNPATGSVRLKYHVEQAGRVRLTLTDALGRVVQTVVDRERVSVGTFETTVSLAGLRAGVYFCTLHTASQNQVERITVTE